VKSVIDFNPEYFKPHLYSGLVKYDAISKKAFYKLFKMMVCSAKAASVDNLSLKIEETEESRKKCYCFYDEVHLNISGYSVLQNPEHTVQRIPGYSVQLF